MYQTRCLVKFKTHCVLVQITEDHHIRCFKYNHNQTHCQLEDFWDEELASDFILEPMPIYEYAADVPDL